MKKEGEEPMSDGKGQSLVTEQLLQGSGTRPRAARSVNGFQEPGQCPGSLVLQKWYLFNMGAKRSKEVFVDEKTPPWEEEVTGTQS